MVFDVFMLIVGTVLLVKGADLFVGGSSAIAKAMRVPPLVIGLTLVSMGTSAPEASVSIISAINGMNDLCVGNVVGSNIFNTLFILGISGAILPLAVGRDVMRYDIPIMLCIYVITIIFAFAVTPKMIDFFEAIALLMLFIAYTAFLIVRSVRADKKATANANCDPVIVRSAECAIRTTAESGEGKQKRKIPLWLSVILTAVGLVGVIFGGDMIVDGASAIAKSFGMSEALVGLTIVAVGTSLPELATGVAAAIKRESDIAVGNIIGSNIFNSTFILGVSSAISTSMFDWSMMTDLAVMLGAGVFVFAVAAFTKSIARWQGAVTAAVYVAYLVYIIVRN